MNQLSSGIPPITRRSFALGGLSLPLGRLWPRRRREILTLSGVEFRALGRRKGTHRYLVIHGDEDTARDVLTAYLKNKGGSGYAVTGKTRIVEIRTLKIDPNRMYSRVGAERSIRNLNPDVDNERVVAALDFLDHERPGLLRTFLPPRGGRLFALHNNREYSVQDEIAASDQTSIRQPNLPRNFFLCTDLRDFDILKQSPYNVVLQARPDPDDGSFSRLAARLGVRYINLECAIGEYDAQLERVRWLDAHVP